MSSSILVDKVESLHSAGLRQLSFFHIPDQVTVSHSLGFIQKELDPVQQLAS